MILNDFIVPKSKYSNETLDKLLVELCELVIKGKQDNPDFSGWVGAAVITPEGLVVTGTAYRYGNKFIHAERAAIDKYEAEYGELPKGCIVVTTLSPCNEDHDETATERQGNSCTDLLNAKQVKLAYCGYNDPTQNHKHNNFTVIITENEKLKSLCKQMADTFLKKGLREAAEPNQAKQFIDSVYSQYPDWPYGQADKVMVWGEGEDQQFAAFKLKPGTAPDTVEIDWIMAGPEQRQGVGSRAIKELQRQAQEAGIKLTLYPWAKGNVSQASLTKLYKRHGFKPIAKGAKPMSWEPISEETNKQILSYIKKIHPKGEFTIDHAVMNHPEWELTSVPLSSLHIESDEVSPYDQINWIDYNHVKNITVQDIKNKPIVVDNAGWIIDGNHRAVAARDFGMAKIPAYVPIEQEEDDGQETYDQHMARVNKERDLSEVLEWDDQHDPEVEEWQTEDVRQHLLTMPHLFENDDRYINLKKFLNSQNTIHPVIGKSYAIVTIKSLPLGNTISIAKTVNSKLLLDITATDYIFKFGNRNRIIPKARFDEGDLLSYTLLFDNVNNLERGVIA